MDDDPIVLSHARAVLIGTSSVTAYIDADARDTVEFRHHPSVSVTAGPAGRAGRG